MSGICKICRCTDDNACYHPAYGSCFWVNEEHDLCSHCAEIPNDPDILRPDGPMLSDLIDSNATLNNEEDKQIGIGPL